MRISTESLAGSIEGLHEPSIGMEVSTPVTGTSVLAPINNRIIIPPGTPFRDIVSSAIIANSGATSEKGVQAVVCPQTMRMESTGAGTSGTKPLLPGRYFSPVRSISPQGSDWIDDYYGHKGGLRYLPRSTKRRGGLTRGLLMLVRIMWNPFPLMNFTGLVNEEPNVFFRIQPITNF